MAGDIVGVTDLTGLRIGTNAVPSGAGLTVGSACTWMGYVTSSSMSTLAVLGNQTTALSVTFSGVTVGDVVLASFGTALPNSVTAVPRVTAVDAVTLVFSNASSTTQTVAGNTSYQLLAFRMSNVTRF